jgi:hypothetical protein
MESHSCFPIPSSTRSLTVKRAESGGISTPLTTNAMPRAKCNLHPGSWVQDRVRYVEERDLQKPFCPAARRFQNPFRGAVWLRESQQS